MSLFRSLHGPVVLVLGPHLGAISGVSAHLQSLLRSGLARDYVLDHLQVGHEGRSESRIRCWLRLASSPFSLSATIRQRRPDILHLNTSLNIGAFWRDLAYALVARLHGVRVVLQIHGGTLPHAFLGGSRVSHALLRALLGLPDAIVVLAEEELRAYRRFLPGRRIVLIPNGIDHAAFDFPRRAVTDARPLQLVFLGRLARVKGVRELLHGLAAALERGASARLAIAGSGPEQRALHQIVVRLGLQDAVTFVGATFGADKAALLRDSDVFVLPSYSEGLPIALLEAMAAGNAVIATPVGAMPDVVVPGTHGMLVPPGDAMAVAAAILAMAADRKALARMQQACRGRVADRYSLEQLARGFAELYGQLVNAQRGRAEAKQAATCAE
jgi:glycosyltransferase involved in cell wall biosynthesis